ncbi:hypothetical protein ACIG56_22275 [Nocardia fusca]|uniref:hypothetical protein n=1 Tax=Nocardia fusca TaxID=941183 RepID=UPI0037CB350A
MQEWSSRPLDGAYAPGGRGWKQPGKNHIEPSLCAKARAHARGVVGVVTEFGATTDQRGLTILQHE